MHNNEISQIDIAKLHCFGHCRLYKVTSITNLPFDIL